MRRNLSAPLHRHTATSASSGWRSTGLRSARKRAGTAAIVALTWLGAPAHAQPGADAAAAVSACQRVTGGSARLDCYDRAFPPFIDTEAQQDAAARRESSADSLRDESTAARERRTATRNERAPAATDHARIVEMQRPSVTTTVLLAADGRVFVRTNTTTVVVWPDAPFEVDIDRSRLGNSIYLVHPRTHERVRVALRD